MRKFQLTQQQLDYIDKLIMVNIKSALHVKKNKDKNASKYYSRMSSLLINLLPLDLILAL